ncbi:DUF748 domain-containing protein [Marinobacter segnicrescens]|uniref:DUF748 domain-containing protein n=1 Tax=Marinobacter segnicrescens TaxID=430453 RepID=UPI003A93BD0C
MTETVRRKPAYCRWWFWLLVLALAWLVTGFGLVPLYLASAIPERVQQYLGWTADTGDVSFNPFTFTLTAEDVKAKDGDGDPVFEAGAVTLNLGFLQLIRGSLNAQQLTLDNPFLRVDLLGDGRTNLAKDWREHGATGSSEGDRSSVQWMLGEGVVNGGRLQLRRLSAGDENEPHTLTLEALGLTVTDVATTDQNEAGSYSLQAVMGEQVLESEGTLSLSPVWSNGRLSLDNVSADTLRAWLGDHLPWSVKSGRLTFETAYQFAHDNQGIALATRDGQLSATRLELADHEQPDQVLASADTLAMQGVAFNLDGPELVISAVTGESLHLDAVVSRDGTLNLTRSLRGSGETSSEGDSGDGRGLRWSVGRLDINKSTIAWLDERPESAVRLALQNVELSLGAMTEQLEEAITYQARGELEQGGTVSANGQFTLAPLTFEGGLNLDQLMLAPFNGYLREVSELEVLEGRLNLSGNIDIDVQDDPLTGTFSGRGSISQFDGRLPDEDDSILAWRELRLDPIEYNFSPARLELGTVTLSEPELGVVQYPHQPLNLVRFLGPASGEPAGSADSEAEGAPPLIFRLRQLDLANGEVRYTDHTPRPSFTSRLHDLEASVSGLSNITPQQGRFSLRGTLDDSGDFRADGTIATLGTDGRSEINATLEELSMPALNSYFGFYLGYRVDSGKLSGEGRYELQGTQLDATNHLVLERLELGEAVQSDAEITAPVRLGLALLRDEDNRVSLEIPVSGDLADPEFSLGPVMMRTLRASLVKAAMSPFNLLGSIADLGDYSPEELGGVAFLAGETTLVMGEYTKMESVAKALEAREEIVLTIRGVALESVDRPALEARLGEDESLPDNALESLASQRGTSLKSLLVEEYGVAEEQIFLREPEVRPGEGGEGPVTIEFELESR